MANCATHVIHVYYMCITHVSATNVLHMYFYTCNIGVGYIPYHTCSSTHVICVSYEHITCVNHVYYMCSTHILQVYELHV